MDKVKYSSKPIKMWIDGTSFKIYSLKDIKSIINSLTYPDNDTTASQDHNFVINKNEDNFSTTFQLPTNYYIRLNSSPDFNQKKFETETKTTIFIPKANSTGKITITGNAESNVINARQWIHSIVGEIHNRERPSVFIGIPVNSEEVQRNFELFQDEILSGSPIQGVDETIFQSPQKLHLTVGVMALMDDSEKDEATASLNSCKTDVIDPIVSEIGQLKIKVSGVACMNDNLTKVNILYANAEIEKGDDVLQKMTNAISDYFYERGLLIQYRDNVKLHVTLMNTKYRKPTAPSTPRRSKWHLKKQTFDATTIVEKYKEFYFGEKIMDSVHLSFMTSKGEDGFYKPLSIVNL